MGWIDSTPDQPTKVALITALRDVTDGKIYVEAQRAKLTRALAVIKEVGAHLKGSTERWVCQR